MNGKTIYLHLIIIHLIFLPIKLLSQDSHFYYIWHVHGNTNVRNYTYVPEYYVPPLNYETNKVRKQILLNHEFSTYPPSQSITPMEHPEGQWHFIEWNGEQIGSIIFNDYNILYEETILEELDSISFPIDTTLIPDSVIVHTIPEDIWGIDSDHPDIISFADSISNGETLLKNVLENIANWICSNILQVYCRDESGNSCKYASDILHSRKGICTEKSKLMVATLRALNIPARRVSGTVKTYGTRIGGHAWVDVFIPGIGFIDVEPTFNCDMYKDNHYWIKAGPTREARYYAKFSEKTETGIFENVNYPLNEFQTSYINGITSLVNEEYESAKNYLLATLDICDGSTNRWEELTTSACFSLAYLYYSEDSLLKCYDYFTSVHERFQYILEWEYKDFLDSLKEEIWLTRTPALTYPENLSVNLSIPATFSWYWSVGADYYKVQISIDDMFNNIVVEDTLTECMYETSNLQKNTEYFWRIKAYDDINESLWSTTWSFKTIPPHLLLKDESDMEHVINHTLQILSQFYDSFNMNQTHFHAQVSSHNDFSSIDLWDSGVVASSDTIIFYSGNNLIDGQRYYFRVRAQTDGYWSEWASLEFRMNTKPSIPQLISPINQTVVTSQLILKSQPSSDNENDNISYSFYLNNSEEFVYALDSVINISNEMDTIQWSPTVALDDNQQHWWRVKSFDGYEYSAFSDTGSFIFNIQNDIPAEFELLTPQNAGTVTSLTPVLDWDSAYDPDPLETVNYTLLLDTPDPGVVTIDCDTATTYTIVNPLLDNTIYYWKIIAEDLAGATTENEGGFHSFKVNTQNDDPSGFALIFPEDSSMVTTHTPMFYWQIAEDVDPQKSTISTNDVKTLNKKTDLKSTNVNITPISPTDYAISDYLFYINDSDDFAGITPISIDTNFFRVESSLDEDAVYYWKVEAIDNLGGVTSSEVWSFWTNKENSLPDTFNIIQPQPEEVFKGTLNTFSYTAANDPDINDEVNYMIYLGTSIIDMQLIDEVPILEYAYNDEMIENTKYYLSIVAKDKSGATRRINQGYIICYVNLQNDIPSVPVLISPDSCAIRRALVKLDWAESIDPDPLDTVSYQVFWKGEWEINSHSLETDTNSVIISEDRENWLFSWYVVSKDKNGGENQSRYASFWLDRYPEEPNSFKTIYPKDGTTGLGKTIEFKWEKATDPDPFDATKYDFVYTTNPEDSSTYEYIPEVYDTTFTMEFIDDGIYYWCVTAHDRTNLMTTSDDHQLQCFTIGNVSIDGDLLVPEEFALHSNFPNPFNPTTTIQYDIPKASYVTLTIYNMNGQVIEKLVNKKQEPGFYSVNWNAWNVSTGIYFYQIKAKNFQQVKKCLLIK